MKISIVTITNRPENLLNLAQQLFKQTGGIDLEHIIVLDHLTLGARLHKELTEQYRRAGIRLTLSTYNKDENCVLFEKLARMRNFGSQKAAGDFLAFWDDDNRWESNHLLSLYRLLINNTDCGAVHSWRRLVDQYQLPKIVKKENYPWITNDSSASRAMYQQQATAGILCADSDLVKDRYGYGPSNEDCCVDTGEWLIRRNTFKEVRGFKEVQSAFEKMYGVTDDQILGLRLLSSGVLVRSTEKPTLIYTLGGNSQIFSFQRKALDITALDLLAYYGAPSLSFPIGYLQQLNDGIIDNIERISANERVPLLPMPCIEIGYASWHVQDSQLSNGLLKTLAQSPYCVGVSEERQATLSQQFVSFPWGDIGDLLEPKIRAKFNIPDDVEFSVIVFGGLVWKTKTQDMDMLVIVEDPTNYTVNVGSPVSSLTIPKGLVGGITQVDISLVGRGALLDREKHSGDLTNICLWSHHGVCVKGKPALQHVSDQNLCQDIFTTLGFGFKDSLLQPGKLIARLLSSLKIALFLADKYGLVLEIDDSILFSQILRDGVLPPNVEIQNVIESLTNLVCKIQRLLKAQSIRFFKKILEQYSVLSGAELNYHEFFAEVASIQLPSSEQLNAQLKGGLIKKTSVAMVSFNRPDMLLRSLRKLLSQRYHHLVIVDNASDLETTALLKLMGLIDSRIHVIFNEENRHLAIARNQALDWVQANASNTELIVVLDNDVELPCNTIEISSNLFRESQSLRQVTMLPALPDFPLGEEFTVAGQQLVRTLHNCTGAQSVYRADLVLKHGIRYREQTFETKHSVGEDFWFTYDCGKLVSEKKLPWKEFAWFAKTNPVLAKDLGRDPAHMVENLSYYIETFSHRKTLDYLKRLISTSSLSIDVISTAIDRINDYELSHGGRENCETPFTLQTLLCAYPVDILEQQNPGNILIHETIVELKKVILAVTSWSKDFEHLENEEYGSIKNPLELLQVVEQGLNCFINILSFTEEHPLFGQNIFQANMYLNRMRICLTRILYEKSMELPTSPICLSTAVLVSGKMGSPVVSGPPSAEEFTHLRTQKEGVAAESEAVMLGGDETTVISHC